MFNIWISKLTSKRLISESTRGNHQIEVGLNKTMLIMCAMLLVMLIFLVVLLAVCDCTGLRAELSKFSGFYHMIRNARPKRTATRYQMVNMSQKNDSSCTFENPAFMKDV